MDTLEKLMKSKGVDPDNMTKEEKATHDTWRAVLKGEKVTPTKIVEFCQAQKSQIESKFEKLDNSPEVVSKLVLLHTVYAKIARMIVSEEKERTVLEQQLESMLDTPNKNEV